MKLLNILLIVLTVFFVTSCQNDAKVENDDHPMIVVKDTSLIETVSDKEYKKIEKNEPKKIVVKKKEKAAIITKEKVETVEEKIDKKDEGKINMREETAADLENEVNVKVARAANPDNDNGSFEIKEDATINIVPVLSAEDKAKYYVQFKIKVSKISKADLSRFFPDTQKIYVVQHQGLYKYCVGQFDNENDAKVYKKQVDKEFGFKNSEVATYSDAW